MIDVNCGCDRIHNSTLVRVRHMEAEIDVEIASLIEELWIAGIHTHCSCQENTPGIAWISFDSGKDAERFLAIVALEYEGDCDSLYARMLGGDWTFDALPDDLAVGDDDVIEPRGSPNISIAVSVRFPRSDIPEVERRLRDHNAADGFGELPPIAEVVNRLIDREAQDLMATALVERGWKVEPPVQ